MLLMKPAEDDRNFTPTSSGDASFADGVPGTVEPLQIDVVLDAAAVVNDQFVLAIVFVNPDDSTDGPYYLRNPFQREPDWGAASVNYTIADLLKRAEGNP